MSIISSEIVVHNQLFIKSLLAKVPKYIKSISIYKDKFTIYCYPDLLIPFLFFLKKHFILQYSSLIDITAVDFLGYKHRFELVYQLTSVHYNHRITVKTVLSPLNNIASSTIVFKSAGWLEREIWDLFGIFFSDHADLRRILTDYGFQGFPLRKDFPLTGFVELRYDDELKRVTYDSLELTQEFRFFDFQSPWQNTEFISK
jgi:NADH dehydrogenase (ubiquinone) Fe-S protein 3